MDKPTVSVFLPTYNRAYIVKKAIESILNQTFKDFELLVVDDASTDNTKEIVDSFDDSRIRYIRKPENKGLTAGHNTAIREARGIYMATLGSDDVWFPQMLEKTVAVLSSAPPDVGIAYARLKKHFLDGRTEFVPPLHERPEGNLYEKLLGGNFITMQVALLKMECFRGELFDENIIALQDWEIWLRIAKKWKFTFVDYVGCEASVMPDSITSKKKLRLDSRRKIFDKHEADFKTHPGIYAKHAFSLGHAYGLSKDIPTGLRYMKKAFFVRPWRPSYVFSLSLLLASSLAGPLFYRNALRFVMR